MAVAGVLAAVSTWALAGWAGVNGPNYDGWSHAFAAFAFVAPAAGAAALVRMPRPNARHIAIAAGGTVLAVVCGGISIHWCGDGHPKTRIASVLAWTGFLGLSLAAGALSLPRIRDGGVA